MTGEYQIYFLNYYSLHTCTKSKWLQVLAQSTISALSSTTATTVTTTTDSRIKFPNSN
jgi:hypothetical protein